VIYIFEFLIILILFVINCVWIYYVQNFKNTLFAGLDLVLIGALLSGYWYGWFFGVLFGALFCISGYVITVGYSFRMLYVLPAVGLVGIIGAIGSAYNISLFITALVAIVMYVFFHFTLKLFFGDRNFLYMGLELLWHTVIILILKNILL